MPCRGRFVAAVLSLCTGYALGQESRSEASASREDAADNAAFQAVCGSCHPLTMVDGLRTESEWMEEIEQMVKIGAKGTDEQFERVIEFFYERVRRSTLISRLRWKSRPFLM